MRRHQLSCWWRDNAESFSINFFVVKSLLINTTQDVILYTSYDNVSNNHVENYSESTELLTLARTNMHHAWLKARAGTFGKVICCAAIFSHIVHGIAKVKSNSRGCIFVIVSFNLLRIIWTMSWHKMYPWRRPKVLKCFRFFRNWARGFGIVTDYYFRHSLYERYVIF